MFSTIVYSVLLAFALSDFGGSGLAVAVENPDKRSGGTECDKAVLACEEKFPVDDNMIPTDACSKMYERAQCLSTIKNAIDGDKKDCNSNLFPEALKKLHFKVPSRACPCCDRKQISDFGKLESTEGDCPAGEGNCMLCKVDVGAVNRTFDDAKTCDQLTKAINKATADIAGPQKCTDNDLKGYLASRTFVIENAADCHTEQCIQLGEELKANYTNLALKVNNGSTEATECRLEGSAAFRIGSAIAPLLGALGIVLITFKIL